MNFSKTYLTFEEILSMLNNNAIHTIIHAQGDRLYFHTLHTSGHLTLGQTQRQGFRSLYPLEQR